MQGSFVVRHEARKTFRQHGILTPMDEKGPPDDDGRMLTAKSKRLRTETAVVHTGGVLEDAAGRITGIGRGIREFFKRRVEKAVRDAVPAATATAPDWSDFIVDYASYIKGSVDGKPYPDGYQAVYEDERYIPIGGYGWSFAMVIDVVRLRALQFASSEQLGTLAETLWVPDGIPLYDKWCEDNDEFIKGQQLLQTFYGGGPMAKIQLQLVRSMLFVKAKTTDGLGMTDEQSQFLDIGFEDWVRALWGRLHNFRKREYLRDYPQALAGNELEEDFIFTDYKEFRHKVFMCVAPDQQISTAYAEFLYEVDNTQEIPLRAQQMDSYYSKLVKGAMVNIPISVVWSPSDETEHSTFDNEKFANIMWKTLVKIMDSESIRRGLSDAQLLKGSVSRIKMLKVAMKDIWEQSILSRVTSEVHMVESMIIDRLHRDGAFPWIGRLSKLHLCFLLRRHEQFRYTFASAVGKRMASERLMSSSRASIIEHHRSASWAEREYLGLYNFMNENASVFESALRTPKDDYMLCDYTDMEKKDDQRQRSRLAKAYVDSAHGQK